MKPEQINRAIAEHCGWKFTPGVALPMYNRDLNAMHEAEKTLNNGEVLKYQDTLIWLVCTLDALFPATRDCAMQGFLHHATSAQRAEAFLRTIGKWNDQ